MKKYLTVLVVLMFLGCEFVLAQSFDGDNENGSIIVARSDGYVSWMKRSGNNLIDIASQYMSDMNEIAVGDIDGDGNGDVLAANTDGYVRWIERNGAAFAERAALYTTPAATIDIGDMDGDLNGDFIASRSDGYSYWGERSGNDLAGVAATYTDARFARIGNIDGDINGDVWLDRHGTYDGYVSWYERSGNDLAGVASIYVGPITALAAGDMDFDGRGDAIVARADGYIFWLEYNGGGGLVDVAAQYTCDNPKTTDIIDIAMGDIDGDGNGDVVVLRSDGYVFWWKRSGNNMVSVDATFVGATAVSIDLGDLNGNGFNDLAVGRSDGYVVWCEASGSTFGGYNAGVAAIYAGSPVLDVVIPSINVVCGEYGYLEGDINKDCVVDFKDLERFSQGWLAETDLGYQIQYKDFNVPQLVTGPVIDGVIGGSEWADAKITSIIFPDNSTAPQIGSSTGSDAQKLPADISGYFYYKWDSTYLYLGFKIVDDVFIAPAALDWGYPDDHVLFAFNPDIGNTTWDNTLTFAIWRDSGGLTQTKVYQDKGGVLTLNNSSFAVYKAVDSSNHSGEMKLKWTSIVGNGGYVPSAADKFGIGILIGDNDASDGVNDVLLLDVSSMEIPSSYHIASLTNGLVCGDNGYVYGDLNYNCKVNMVDFALFADNWLKCTDPGVVGCVDAR
ncbi:MAG: FG-GAP-like repeat-containing protein [Sedimentisphaerales bacterium]